MPMVSVKWVSDGRTKAQRDAIVKGITQTVHDATGIPKPDIWVAFEDVAAKHFYTGAVDVAAQRAAAKKAKRGKK